MGIEAGEEAAYLPVSEGAGVLSFNATVNTNLDCTHWRWFWNFDDRALVLIVVVGILAT